MDILPSSRQPQRTPWSRERLVRERAIALGYVIELSTRASYSSALQSYLTFRKAHNFPIDPTPETLSFYTVYMCHHIQPRSVNSYLSGISNQLEPYFPNVRTARKSALVSRTLAGAQKQFSNPTSRKQPLAIENLSAIISSYPNPAHDDILFITITLCGFFALHRLGELTQPDNSSLRDPRKLIKRSSVRLLQNMFSYMLPGHKADRFFEGNTVLISKQLESADPFSWFSKYLHSRDHLFPLQSPLWLRENGLIPSRSWFLDRLHHFLPPSYAGHSLRSGGATFFASAGWPDDRIQALGRWTSDAFRVYIRKNPILLQALLHSSPSLNRL